jgi:hypothetical protein
MNTTQHQGRDRSQLFLVRLWAEQDRDEIGDCDGSASTIIEIEWHGKLQQVVSGQACYFDGLSNLAPALEKMIEPEKG